MGAVIVGDGPSRNRGAFRIEKIENDPDDPDGDILLYSFSEFDPKTEEWKPLCNPDQRGIAAGFPLAGSWDEQGTHLHDDNFSITCTSGAIGKCVRYGYKPWKTAKDGTSMWEYHQACTRMLRADYCGNGLGHTRDGTLIDIIDRLGLMKEELPGLSFEAAWTPEGATCVTKPRLSPSPWSLEDIAKECPEKLQGRVGDPKTCNLDAQSRNERVLFFNRS